MFRIGGTAATTFPVSGNPWSTTHVQTRPSYTFLTPGQILAAEELNYILGGVSDAAAAGVSVPGCSWLADLLPATLSGAPDAFCAAYYNVPQAEWILGISDGSGSHPGSDYVLKGSGLPGDGWVNVDTGASMGLTGKITAVGSDVTHYFAAGVRASDGAGLIYACTPGGAFSATVTNTSEAFTDLNWILFNGQIVVTMWSIGTGVSYSSPQGSLSWSLTGLPGFVNNATQGYSAASPTILIAVPNSSTASNYVSTPNGVSWTARSLPITYNDNFTGLCYSPSDTAFILSSSGTDGKGHIYISYDGLTWTEQGKGFSSVPVFAGLAATSAGCIISNPPFGSANYPIYSVDMGASWHISTLAQANPGFTPKTLQKVVASPFNFFAFNNSHGRFSHGSGFGPALT